jgi:hypothetical protein
MKQEKFLGRKIMDKYNMQVAIRRLSNHPNIFEFSISTPTLRTQFRVPRETLNELRILIERALTTKLAKE